MKDHDWRRDSPWISISHVGLSQPCQDPQKVIGVLALGPRRPGPRQYTLSQVELVKYSVGVRCLPGHSMAKGTPCPLGGWDSRW